MNFISVPETEISNDVEKLLQTTTVAEWGADKLSFKAADTFQAFCKLAGLKAEECVTEHYVGLGTGVQMKCYTWRNEEQTCFLSMRFNPLCEAPRKGDEGEYYAGYLGVTAERELALKLKQFAMMNCCYEDLNPDEREFI